MTCEGAAATCKMTCAVATFDVCAELNLVFINLQCVCVRCIFRLAKLQVGQVKIGCKSCFAKHVPRSCGSTLSFKEKQDKVCLATHCYFTRLNL